MANNRIAIFHRPSGKALIFGKRMGFGWYTGVGQHQLGDRFQAFFDECEDGSEPENQDDFVLAMEDPPKGSTIAEYWLDADNKPTLTKPEDRK